MVNMQICGSKVIIIGRFEVQAETKRLIRSPLRSRNSFGRYWTAIRVNLNGICLRIIFPVQFLRKRQALQGFNLVDVVDLRAIVG